MSDVVIKVENLSKKYIIGHQKQERYTALRDVISNGAKNFWQNLTGDRQPSLDEVSEEFWALKDVNFEIKQGDRVGIIGRNGAGKSTLLKILSRITEPTSGKISIKGRVASLLEVGTGFHPELTGRENIYLNGAILGMDRYEIKKKFDEIIAFAEVEKFLDTPVKRYSSGMYVRLAFAVAAHLEPEILIVDEVLAVGDTKFQQKCLGKMKKIGDQGRTVLFVSHQMGTIAQLCGKSILIDKGIITKYGDTQEVISHYMNSNENVGIYLSIPPKDKEVYIKEVAISNDENQATVNFRHTDQVTLKIKCYINQDLNNIVLAASVKDKLGRRVFSSQVKINDYDVKVSNGILTGLMKIPRLFLTPGQYSFFIIIHIPQIQVLDTIDDICPFTIIDAGSEFASYEGSDYGCVFANCEWIITKI